ncbi:hypothetical protein SMICM17S_08740 [Streptomyces microflavus]
MESVTSRLLGQQFVALHQFTQARHRVAGLVGAVVGGQDAQFGTGLGVQQEQNAIEVAQRLPGELPGERQVRALDVARVEPGVLQAFQDRVGDDLDGLLESFAQLSGDSDRVVAGRLDQRVNGRRFAVLGRCEYVVAEQARDCGEFAVLTAIVALQGGVEVGGEVATLAPGMPVGEDDDAATQEQYEPRGRATLLTQLALEQPGGESLPGLVTLTAARPQRVEQAAVPVRIERRVVARRPAAVQGYDAVAVPCHGHLVLAPGAVHGQGPCGGFR